MSDSLLQILVQMAANKQPQESPWYTEPIAVLTFLIVVVLVNFFTIYKIIRDLKHQQRLFIESQNLKQRDDIQNRLNKFFGPFKELGAESTKIYDVFALAEKESVESQEEHFRTLRFLASGSELKPADQALLKQILTIGKKQLDLIEMEGWVVDNSRLSELLGKLGAHIRVLLLAEDGKLTGMADDIADLVFPLEVDGAIESEIRKLQDRYDDLLKAPDQQKRKPDLDEIETRTVAYYDQNADQYYHETAHLDLSDIYAEFRREIPRGAFILDAGCGVGRDTRFFIRHGYRVVSFDASEQMVAMCHQYPFSYCLHMSFPQLKFLEVFDAVWANASLIHVSPGKIPEVLLRLVNAVKPGGVIYFSLKNATGSSKNNGRKFYYYEEQSVDDIAVGKLSLVKVKSWTNKSRKASDQPSWTNYLYRKPMLLDKV